MSKGDHQHPETRQRRFREADPRLRNFLVSVILLTLREWNSYGYELMERMAAFGFEAINPGPHTLRDLSQRADPIPLLQAASRCKDRVAFGSAADPKLHCTIIFKEVTPKIKVLSPDVPKDGIRLVVKRCASSFRECRIC